MPGRVPPDGCCCQVSMDTKFTTFPPLGRGVGRAFLLFKGGGSPPRVKSRRLTPLSGQFFFFFSLTGNMIKWCEVTFKLGDLDPPTDPPSFRNIPASPGPPGVPRCFSSHLLLWQVGQGSLQMIQKGSHQVDAAARYPWIPNSPRSHLWTGR